MGLTLGSTGLGAVDSGLDIKKLCDDDIVIALAGNPNVGKSTVFNALTGLRQHTGNWPGKTVASAQGICRFEGKNFVMVDIPGTYSLLSHSAEEDVARDFICFGNPDGVIVVCDATCLERNLNLVLQILEITENVVVCVNLIDEAEKKDIKINLKLLSKKLGVPVVGTSAAKKKGLQSLMRETLNIKDKRNVIEIKYTKPIESALEILTPAVSEILSQSRINPRFVALKLLSGDEKLCGLINEFFGFNVLEAVSGKYAEAMQILTENGITPGNFSDKITSCLVLTAEYLCADTVLFDKNTYNERDRKIDKILTGRLIGYPLMILLLGMVLWITIVGANYPSAMLSSVFEVLGTSLFEICIKCGIPPIICDFLINGVYKVLTWVVAVMLPPMAIFFPLFTLLEDLGYLPRIAFNLDKTLKKCSACGKQSLTMCMGFGCNAAGIVGCRIIDSPRERLIAILTNNFVPCNGRFPTIITLIGLFFIGGGSGLLNSAFSAAFLTLVILLGIAATFGVSWLLSKTLLRGTPSSFTLELPPYRRPAIGRVIVRSVFDRTLFVLARAATVAAPAGAVIWIMANINLGELSLLAHCSNFLDPFARLIGLDGVILFAFILGLPANEIILPIIVMAYTASGTLTDITDINNLKSLLTMQGWDIVTAINVIVFSLMHWPCATTLLTIKKETGSIRWTAAAFIIPTVCGIAFCFLNTVIMR